MKTQLQVVETTAYQAYKAVALHHEVSEDFTVYRTAGIISRWYALTLDIALSTPINVLLHLPFKRYLERMSVYDQHFRYWVLWLALGILLLMLYFIAPTLLFGQTLGKRIVGLRVLRSNCNPNLSFGAVFCRETVGKILSLGLAGIGFLFPLFNERQRALHDYLAGTIVVEYRQR